MSIVQSMLVDANGYISLTPSQRTIIDRATQNVYKDYLDLVQDENYTSLYYYYSQETVMDILGVARQENPHSSFLRWLLDMKGEHSLGSLPVRKLLEM